MPHDIFISYAAEDKHVADAVCQAIESQGIRCWYAPRDVQYGQDFEESIVDAICASRLIILILTSHSNTSAHVKREIQNACLEEVSVPVLPFRVEDIPLNKALRYYIGSVHWFDAVTLPLEPHLQKLVEHVRARLPQPIKSSEEADRERDDSVPQTETKENVADLAKETSDEDAEVEAAKSKEKGAQRGETEASEEKQGPEEAADKKAHDEESLSGPPPQVPNYLAPAIVATVLCCPPAGVISIVFALQANSKAAAGDIAGAVAKSKLAKVSLIGAIVLGFALYFSLTFGSIISSCVTRSNVNQPINQPSPRPTATTNSQTNGNAASTGFSLLGLSVDVFYLSPNKNTAERIAARLKANGAQVEMYERNDPGSFFKDQTQLFYYGERKDDAKKIARAVADLDTVQVDTNSAGTTHEGAVQFYIWVGKATN